MANALEIYLAAAPRGTAARLAKHLGIAQVSVSQWIADEPRPVPVKQRPSIERFTNGAVPVEAHDGPDLAWTRIRDDSWPWHPDGRPVLDVTRSAAAQEVSDAV